MSPVEPLEAEALRAALRGQRIGRRIVVLDETRSTNDAVFEMAGESEEGLVIFAERQTAGRGQHGRRWESAAQTGLWFSVLLRPEIQPDEAVRLTRWAAETIAKTIGNLFSLPATVKPPNDVYVGDRKVAGVLLEMRAVTAAPHLGILGIGLNVNQEVKDFPEELRHTAASLAMILGRPVDRHVLAVALLRELERTYRPALPTAL